MWFSVEIGTSFTFAYISAGFLLFSCFFASLDRTNFSRILLIFSHYWNGFPHYYLFSSKLSSILFTSIYKNLMPTTSVIEGDTTNTSWFTLLLCTLSQWTSKPSSPRKCQKIVCRHVKKCAKIRKSFWNMWMSLKSCSNFRLKTYVSLLPFSHTPSWLTTHMHISLLHTYFYDFLGIMTRLHLFFFILFDLTTNLNIQIVLFHSDVIWAELQNAFILLIIGRPWLQYPV